MKAIVFDAFGDESVLRLGDVGTPTCGAGQVLLRVAATAVNRADVLQRMGLYPPPRGASDILGLEASGRIAAIGEGVEGWRVGDTAMALLSGGGYSARVVVDARHLMPVPSGLSLVDAAAVPEVFITAFLNLFEIGGLAAGERAMVHGGSGGVGTAAIQLASRAGAEVWTTAGTAERRTRCEALGAHRALDYRVSEGDAASWPQMLRTAGGADVILDVVGAAALDANLGALAYDGRLVIIGLQGGRTTKIDLGRMLMRRLRIIGSILRAQTDDAKARLVARFVNEIWPAFDTGDLEPVISHRLPLADAADAHRLMLQSGHFGKIVLVVDETA